MKLSQQWAVKALAFLIVCAGGTAALAQIPDIAAGQKRAQVCFACHGENGQGNQASFCNNGNLDSLQTTQNLLDCMCSANACAQ